MPRWKAAPSALADVGEVMHARFRKMNIRLGVSAVVAFVAVTVEAGTIVRVAGRVVDGAGNPVADVRIAEFWFAEQSAPLAPVRPALSDNDGRFSLEVELHGRDSIVMAMDSAGMLGGAAIVPATASREPIDIELQPLVEVRFRYASEQPNRSLNETYATLSLGEKKLRIAGGRSRTAEFSMKLPPGQYTIHGSEVRHDKDVREFRLEPGMDTDLGNIRLKPSKFTRLIGKPAPAWHISDVRGVLKDVQPADFKGKWVVLEFWGYWCGACTYRGLPGWIDFVNDHAADSDKFVVLAIHDPQAADFAMLDEKLQPVVRRVWHGQSLPFPILLDLSGRMVKDYGVEGWPTAVLIDPEGRVVDVPRKSSCSEAGLVKTSWLRNCRRFPLRRGSHPHSTVRFRSLSRKANPLSRRWTFTARSEGLRSTPTPMN